MRLKEALDIKRGEVISLVGGGGKTSLMFALARELSESGKSVITTTTTRIEEPSPEQTEMLIVEADGDRLMALARQHLGSARHITVARERLPDDKLKGISPELVDRLAGVGMAYCIIVEADGAGGRPLKAPIEKEPVIPPNTSLVIPVVGVEAAGCRLSEKDVFRTDTVAGLLGLPLGATVSAEHIAFLVTHPKGMTKGSPPQARIIPFINKMDMDGAVEKGREVARKILEMKHPRIDRVVLGQAKSAEPVVEVIFA